MVVMHSINTFECLTDEDTCDVSNFSSYNNYKLRLKYLGNKVMKNVNPERKSNITPIEVSTDFSGYCIRFKVSQLFQVYLNKHTLLRQ